MINEWFYEYEQEIREISSWLFNIMDQCKRYAVYDLMLIGNRMYILYIYSYLLFHILTETSSTANVYDGARSMGC